MQIYVVVFLAVLCLGGCSHTTTNPSVWRARDVAFSSYQMLEILPLFNTTGQPIAKELLEYYNELLEKELAERNLVTSSSTQNTINGILLVQSSVVRYDTNKAVPLYDISYIVNSLSRKSFAVLNTLLIDKNTTREVANITTATTSGAVGSLLNDASKRFFHEIAEATAVEIAKVMAPEDTQ